MHAEDIWWTDLENLDYRQNVLELRIMTPLPVGNDWKRKSEKLEKLTTSGSVVNRLHVAWLQNHRLVFEIPINKSFPKRRGWDDNWGVCLKGFLTENNGEGYFLFLLEIMDCKVVKLTLNSDYHGDTV